MRTDRGTENVIAAGIQAYIHQNDGSHRYGKSTTNQRIEAMWSKLRSTNQNWMDFFRTLVDNGEYDCECPVQVRTFRFCFMRLVQLSLDNFLTYWNSHCIRQSSECPGGVPDILHYSKCPCGVTVTPQQLRDAFSQCNSPCGLTGDLNVDNYLKDLMARNNLIESSTKNDAVNLYQRLLRLQ